jgi:hypothetical protein
MVAIKLSESPFGRLAESGQSAAEKASLERQARKPPVEGLYINRFEFRSIWGKTPSHKWGSDVSGLGDDGYPPFVHYPFISIEGLLTSTATLTSSLYLHLCS